MDLIVVPCLPFNEIDLLPEVAAVYLVRSNSETLYIGSTQNLRARWRAHHITRFLIDAGDLVIGWYETPDYQAIEKRWIEAQKPSLNGKEKQNKAVEQWNDFRRELIGRMK